MATAEALLTTDGGEVPPRGLLAGGEESEEASIPKEMEHFIVRVIVPLLLVRFGTAAPIEPSDGVESASSMPVEAPQ